MGCKEDFLFQTLIGPFCEIPLEVFLKESPKILKREHEAGFHNLLGKPQNGDFAILEGGPRNPLVGAIANGL